MCFAFLIKKWTERLFAQLACMRHRTWASCAFHSKEKPGMGNLLKAVVTLLVFLEASSSKIPGFWEHDARINVKGKRVCDYMLAVTSKYLQCLLSRELRNTYADINEKWHCERLQHFRSYLSSHRQFHWQQALTSLFYVEKKVKCCKKAIKLLMCVENFASVFLWDINCVPFMNWGAHVLKLFMGNFSAGILNGNWCRKCLSCSLFLTMLNKIFQFMWKPVSATR